MKNPIEKSATTWKAKCEFGSVPFRRNLDALNPDTEFLLARDDGGKIKIRHSPLYFDALHGSSLDGRNWEDLFDRHEHDQVKALSHSLFYDANIVKLWISTPSSCIQLALFPLRADNGRIDFALGSVNLVKMPKQEPASFKLLTSQVVETKRDTRVQAVVGFAEPKSPFIGKPSPFKVIHGEGQRNPNMKDPRLNVIKSIKHEP